MKKATEKVCVAQPVTLYTLYYSHLRSRFALPLELVVKIGGFWHILNFHRFPPVKNNC